MKVGVDIMGGDHAPQSTIEGAILAQKELSDDIQIVLFGDEAVLKEELSRHSDAPEFEIIHCSEKVEMSDHPTRVFSQKPESSIAKGFKALKIKEIDAFSSIGNTGAMLVGAMYYINTIPGIIRPCLTSYLPKENGQDGLILDVGANADCKPDVLYQFAILGSHYMQHVMGVKNPRVGLLNIGEEEEKGNLLSIATHELMKGSGDFNFVGNVEGRDLFNSKADLIVCDGFTGNIVLKQAEALYTLVRKRNLKDEYFDKFNYESYGGTAVLRVNGNVVVGHGISNALAIKNMVLHSVEIVEAGLTNKIKLALDNE